MPSKQTPSTGALQAVKKSVPMAVGLLEERRLRHYLHELHWTADSLQRPVCCALGHRGQGWLCVCVCGSEIGRDAWLT